jgi:hypothetical protein
MNALCVASCSNRGVYGIIARWLAQALTKEFCLVDIRRPRGESWRARAPERKGSVQAPAVGITAPGVDRAAAYKAQAYCPRAEGLVPWAFAEPHGVHLLMNSLIVHRLNFDGLIALEYHTQCVDSRKELTET